MTFRTAFITIIFFLFSLTAQASTETGPSQMSSSFFQLVGETSWQINLKDFSVSTIKDGKIFILRAGEGRYLSFSAHPENGGKDDFFGPLLPAYAPALTQLLDFARQFGEMEKSGEFSLNVDWELYAESIRNWAAVWKNSELRERWKDMDSRERYSQLVTMITNQLKEDMQPLAEALGMEITGASMEKMSFQEVLKLPYFEKTLKPAGVPADLKLPIPLMLSVRIKMLEHELISPPEKANPVMVDSLFATAKSSSTSLYCSFQRALDEYEISGDRLNPKGTYGRLLPLSQKEYHPMAAQLLNASLQATGGDDRRSFSLRLNLGLYPEVFQEVVKQFTFTPDQARQTMVTRPQLPKRPFYTFEPSQASGFANSVNSFLQPNGYEYRHLLVSVDSRRKAANYPSFAETLKPLGIKAGDRPAVPDIVYLIVGKKN